jgi:hypothetical protein
MLCLLLQCALFLIFGTQDRGQHVKAVSWEKRNIVFNIIIFNPSVQILLDGGNFCSNKINSLLDLAFLENVILRYIFVYYCYLQFQF